MLLLEHNRGNYSERLRANLRDIPFAIYEHLLAGDSILRPKQREATEAVAYKIFNGSRAVAQIMPTATGKTVIIARMLAGLKLNEAINHIRKKIVIVTSTVEGLHQTRNKLKAFANIDAGAYYEHEKDVSKDVVVTTYASWQKDTFPIDPEDVDLVITDEGHRGLSEARIAKLKKHNNAIWWTLTASPKYSEERDLLNYYDLGYRLTIEEAVDSRSISGIRNMLLRSEVEVNLEDIGSGIEGEYNEDDLERILNTRPRNQVAADTLLYGTHPDTGKPLRDIRGIISCVSIKHAQDVEEHINELYNKAYPDHKFEHGFVRCVYGRDENREDILKWHQEGKIGYLAYADLLNENYDDYKIGVCLNLRLSRSHVIVIQRPGRAERLDPDDPNKIALVIEIFDTYKGKTKRKPLFYANAIGYAALIPEEMQQSALIEKMKRNHTQDSLSEEELEKLKDLELRIVVKEEELLSLLYEAAENNEDIRDKTDNDLNPIDVMQITGVKSHYVRNIFNKIRKEWDLYDANPEVWKAPSVIVETVRTSAGNTTSVITRDQIEELKRKYFVSYFTRKKTDDDLIIPEIVKLIDVDRQTLRHALNKIYAQWEMHRTNPEEHKKPLVSVYKVKIEKGTCVLSVKKSQLDILKEKYLSRLFSRDKTENDLSASDIAVMAGISKSTAQNALNVLLSEWEEYDADSDGRNEPLIVAEVVKNKSGGPVFSIGKQQFGLFREKYLSNSFLRSKTENDLSIPEIAELTGFSTATISKALDNVLKELAHHRKDPDFYPAPLIVPEKVKNSKGGNPFLTIPSEQLDIFKEKYLPKEIYRQMESDDLISADLEKILNISREQILSIFKKIREEQELSDTSLKEHQEAKVKLEKVVPKNGKFTYAIKRDELDNLKEYISCLYDRPQTDEDLTVIDVMERTGLSYTIVRAAFNRILVAWKFYDHDPKTHEKPPLAIEKVRSKKGPSADTIKKADLDIFENYFIDKIVPDKTDQVLTVSDIAEQTKLSVAVIRDTFKEIQEEWKLHDSDPKKNVKPFVELISVKTERGNIVNSIRKEKFEHYKDTYLVTQLLPRKTRDDLNISEVATLVERGKETIDKIFKGIIEEWAFYNANQQSNAKPSIVLNKVNTNGRCIYSLSRKDLDLFKDYLKLKLTRNQTDQDLTIANIAKLTGLGAKTISNSFKKIQEEWDVYNANQEAKEKPLIILDEVMVKMPHNNLEIGAKCAISIKRDQYELYKDKYLAGKFVRVANDDDLCIPEISSIMGLSKSTIVNAFRKIIKEWKEYDANPQSKEKPLIAVEEVRKEKHGNPSYAIKRDQCELLKEKYLADNFVRPKTDEDLSVTDVVTMTGLSRGAVRNAFNRMLSEWQEHKEKIEELKKQGDEKKVGSMMDGVGQLQEYCLRKVEEVRKAQNDNEKSSAIDVLTFYQKDLLIDTERVKAPDGNTVDTIPKRQFGIFIKKHLSYKFKEFIENAELVNQDMAKIQSENLFPAP